jgi:hypothetical protein
MNSGCFEGMFIHRDIVGRIGLPDPRFFIYWDDQTYGWLASRITTSVIVNEFVLRRTREIKQWDMGIRHMNASSNAYRYYIMRNRAIIKRYRSLGVYNPVLFGFGTALTFGKELIRLLFVERTVRAPRTCSEACATDARSRGMPPGSPCRRWSRRAGILTCPSSACASRRRLPCTRHRYSSVACSIRDHACGRAACTASRAWTSLRESST